MKFKYGRRWRGRQTRWDMENRRFLANISLYLEKLHGICEDRDFKLSTI